MVGKEKEARSFDETSDSSDEAMIRKNIYMMIKSLLCATNSARERKLIAENMNAKCVPASRQSVTANNTRASRIIGKSSMSF